MADETVQDPLIGNLQNEASNFASEFIPDTPKNSPATMAARGEIPMGQAVRQEAASALSPQALNQAREVGAYSVPILGEGLAARDAYKAMQDHDWTNAAINAVGTVPLLGGIFAGARGAEALAQAGRPAAKEAMALAEKLKAEGATPDQIWKQTSDYIAPHEPNFAGVHYGADGKPRFEISDYDAKLSGMKYIPETAPRNWMPSALLSPPAHPEEFHFSGIHHPDYEAAYGIEGLPSYLMRGRIGAHLEPHASYNEPAELGLGLMDVQARTPGEAKDSALHELTHHIQNTEGFALGAHPAMAPFPENGEGGAWPYYRDALEDALTPMGFDEYIKTLQFPPDAKKAAEASYSEYLAGLHKIATTGEIPKRLDDSLMGTAQLNWYLRNRGEVEAENVVSRARMTPEQRRMIPPQRTQEFPYEEQTVREMDKAKGGEVTSEHALPEWAKPYFAAGLRAHARGEHFYGGTPEYEADLAQFKRLHETPGEAPTAPTAPEGLADGGVALAYSDLNPPPNLSEILKNRPKRTPQEDALANEYLRQMQKAPPKPESPKPERLDMPRTYDQMPNLPVPGTSDPMPNVTRYNQFYEPMPALPPDQMARGGKVTTPESKKLGSIGMAFEKKLEAKHKVITSIEKALAKKPNAKLNEKLNKEKEEAKRIEEHLAKVRSFH